jgi:hypothetical protein
VKLRSELSTTLPATHSFEQTASTAPSQLPEAIERVTPRAETSATSRPPNALAFAQLLIAAVMLSPVTASRQAQSLPPWRRHEIVVNAESSQAEVDPAVVEQMRRLFERGTSEFFEDGMESNFARELLLSVMEYGNAAISAIAEYVFSSTANSEVGSEALRRLADVEDRRILASRWDLLQRALRHRSSRVRGGAILGFASLDDHGALELLERVETEEPLPELQKLIRKVIEQLGVKNAKIAPQS